MSGTRFIGHRRRAFKTLLNVWPSFIMAYENVISDENTQSEIRAKVAGLLKKFKNYNYITMTCLYPDILEKIAPASKVFEGERLLPFEVKASIQTTIADLTDYLDNDYDDIAIYNGFFQSLTAKEYQDISLKFNTTVHKIRVGNWRTASLSQLSSPLT